MSASLDVLIPTYDRPSALAVTLAGLAAQEMRDFRVVISDQSDEPVFDAPEVAARYPYVPTLRSALEALKPRPVTPYYSQMSADALQPNFGAAMTRQKEPAQAVADMASGIEQVLSQ